MADKNKQTNNKFYMGLGAGLGVAIDTALGVAFDNIALGLGLASS